MDTHKKSCVYCEEFIPIHAYTCSNCKNEQIGISKAKEDYHNAIWQKTAPAAYLVLAPYLFAKSIAILMYSANELSSQLVLLIILPLLIGSVFVELYVLARFAYSLYSNYGQSGWQGFIFFDLYLLIKALFTGKIFHLRLDTKKYAISPPVPVIVEDIRKMKVRAKFNLAALSLFIIVIIGVSVISYQNRLTTQEFQNFLKEDSDYNEHFSKLIFDAGIFSMYGAVSTYGSSSDRLRCVARTFISIGKKPFRVSLKRHQLPPVLEEMKNQCYSYLNNIPMDHWDLAPKGDLFEIDKWYRNKEEGKLLKTGRLVTEKDMINDKLNQLPL